MGRGALCSSHWPGLWWAEGGAVGNVWTGQSISLPHADKAAFVGNDTICSHSWIWICYTGDYFCQRNGACGIESKYTTVPVFIIMKHRVNQYNRVTHCESDNSETLWHWQDLVVGNNHCWFWSFLLDLFILRKSRLIKALFLYHDINEVNVWQQHSGVMWWASVLPLFPAGTPVLQIPPSRQWIREPVWAAVEAELQESFAVYHLFRLDRRWFERAGCPHAEGTAYLTGVQQRGETRVLCFRASALLLFCINVSRSCHSFVDTELCLQLKIRKGEL